MVIHRICAVAKDFPLFQIGCAPVKLLKSRLPCVKQFLAACLQKTGAAIQRSHQRIGRRTGLKYVQLSLYLCRLHDPVKSAFAHMQQCRLGQTGQGLVGTLDHQIRTAGHRSLSKGIPTKGKPQVCPMGLIYHQCRRRGPIVTALCDLSDIRQYPLVGRAGQDHRLDGRIFVQQFLHFSRRHTAVDPESLVHGGRDPVHPEIAQLNGMINGFMAVAGYDHLTAPGRCRPHRRQISAGAAAHQIPGPVCSAQRRRALHGLPQDSLGIVKIIGSCDLRDIPRHRQIRYRREISLMPRHMKRILSLFHQGL